MLKTPHLKSRGTRARAWTLVALVAGALSALAISDAALARGGGGGHGGGGGGGHGGGGFHGGFHASHGGGARFSSRSFSYGSRSFSSRSVSRSSGYSARTSRSNSAQGVAAANTLSHGNGVASSRLTARNANAVRHSFSNRQVNRALHAHGGLRNPASRAAITAAVATAAWHHGHGHDGHGGWWRHGNGGYGWVGPVFWPYAYYDMYDYAFWGWGYDPSFWYYGYDDLYAGMFGLYGYDDLSGYAGYLPRRVARGDDASATSEKAGRTGTSLADMCGEDSRNIAGLPTDRVRDTLALNDEQRTALDELASASQQAAQSIRDSCPGDAALTAPSRLANMQQRIQAMRAGVTTMQAPLEKFYGLLTDEQKAKLNGLAEEQRPTARRTAAPPVTTGTTAGNAPSCDSSQPGATEWPGALIERTVQPTDAQRTSLNALQEATAKAADILKASCQPNDPRTPPARMAAIGARLDAMDQAVGTVRPPLETFYNSLSDEQKANFDAIGLQRGGVTSASAADDDSEAAAGRHRRHRHGVSVGGLIHRMMRMVP